MLTAIKAGGTGPEDVERLRVGKAYIKGGTEVLLFRRMEWSDRKSTTGVSNSCREVVNNCN